MLAAVLPGIRNVRTPLVVGSLYLLAVWLIFGPEHLNFDPRGETTAEKRVGTLIRSIPDAALWSAAGFVAVMIGSLLTIRRWPWSPRGRLGSLSGPTERANPITDEYFNDLSRRLGAMQLTAREVNDSEIFAPAPFWAPSAVNRWPNGDRAEVDTQGTRVSDLDEVLPGYLLVEPTMAAVRQEADVLLTRLKVERESLYNDIDRQQSEAELRYSIIPPLVAIAFCMISTWHWAAALALLVPVLLTFQARSIELASDREVFIALQHGVIESPTVEALISLAASSNDAPDERDVALVKSLKVDLGADGQLLSWVRDSFDPDRFSIDRWDDLVNTMWRWRNDAARRFHDEVVQRKYEEMLDSLDQFVATVDEWTSVIPSALEATNRGVTRDVTVNGDILSPQDRRLILERIDDARQAFLKSHARLLKTAHLRGL